MSLRIEIRRIRRVDGHWVNSATCGLRCDAPRCGATTGLSPIEHDGDLAGQRRVEKAMFDVGWERVCHRTDAGDHVSGHACPICALAFKARKLELAAESAAAAEGTPAAVWNRGALLREVADVWAHLRRVK